MAKNTEDEDTKKTYFYGGEITSSIFQIKELVLYHLLGVGQSRCKEERGKHRSNLCILFDSNPLGCSQAIRTLLWSDISVALRVDCLLYLAEFIEQEVDVEANWFAIHQATLPNSPKELKGEAVEILHTVVRKTAGRTRSSR